MYSTGAPSAGSSAAAKPLTVSKSLCPLLLLLEKPLMLAVLKAVKMLRCQSIIPVDDLPETATDILALLTVVRTASVLH